MRTPRAGLEIQTAILSECCAVSCLERDCVFRTDCGTPSAFVLALMLVKVNRVDHGWKLVIAFHSLPEMLP